MSNDVKHSRCGFVVIKLRIGGEWYLLMRENRRWKDLNFIGGHERSRDGGSLERAARRELLEEVPALRDFKDFILKPLTGEIGHGPIYSRSARSRVEYALKYFLVRFHSSPQPLVRAVGPRSLNRFVLENDVVIPRRYRISGLVTVLAKALPQGLESLAASWEDEIEERIRNSGPGSCSGQMEFAMEWPG